MRAARHRRQALEGRWAPSGLVGPVRPGAAAAGGPLGAVRARPGAVELGLVAGVALLADLVLAATLPGVVVGRRWEWPPASDLLASAVGPLLDPSRPCAAWPAGQRAQLAGPVAYWVCLGSVLIGEAVVAGACAWRLLAPGRRGAAAVRFPGAPRGPRARIAASGGGDGARRPGGLAMGAGRRRLWVLYGLGQRGPADRRNRHGFAGLGQLRAEASLGAARRRATQTRPSLARSSPARKLAGEDVGYPLGRVEGTGMQLVAHWEASLRLVAPPGEGKTFRALAPVLRQHPGPALATSTKADLYELTAAARERRGPVVALDPDGLVPAAAPVRWSPVAGCERSEVAERRAAALVAATGDDGDVQNGGFFRDSARDLLKAYLHAASLEGFDMRTVLEWSRRPDDPTPSEVLASSPFAAPGWADLVELHTGGAAETTSGVLRYVGRALACFSHRAVVDACCPAPGEETEVAELLRANGTVFLLGKGSRLAAVAPLVTAFADEVFDCAERLAAAMPGRRLDPPLLGLLDEAPSIAPLPSLPERLADGRGRGIVVVYAMQSFSQAVTRWGASRAETMANATSITVVLGGLTSASDLGELERLCGQRRVRRVAVQQGSRGRNGSPGSTTLSWESEPVLRADQLRTLPSGVGLVLWGRLPPVLARLPLLSETPEWPVIREEERATRLANDMARCSGAPIGPKYSKGHSR